MAQMSSPPIGIHLLHLLVIFLLTTAASAAASAVARRKQQPSLCANSMVTEACRGFSGRQQPSGRGCHEQLLMIVCSVRSLRCPPQQSSSSLPSVPPPSQPPLENPICLQSCLRVFRRCSSSGLSLLSYLTITDDLCASLPNQLCQDWREHSQRDDRSVGPDTAVEQQNICRPVEVSPCKQAVYIGDVAKRRKRGVVARLRHPFKKSNFRDGNYTYAAVVKLVKAEWRQEVAPHHLLRQQQQQQPPMLGDQPPQQLQQQHQVYQGGYEKVLHLEIIRVLHNRGGRVGGHMLDPGSVQIVRLAPGCACTPVKLDHSLIFVGYNSYLENVWKTVTLLPNNSHYACKIKRCWNKRRRPAGSRQAGGGGDPCECPCGKSERRRCQRRRHAKRRRGTSPRLLARIGGGGGGWRRVEAGSRSNRILQSPDRHAEDGQW